MSLIILETPHSRPSTAWYAHDEQDFIDKVEATYGHNGTIYEEITAKDAEQIWGVDEIPEGIQSILDKHGKYIEVNNGSGATDCLEPNAISKFDAYVEYNGHDLQSQKIMTAAEAKEYGGNGYGLVQKLLKEAKNNAA